MILDFVTHVNLNYLGCLVIFTLCKSRELFLLPQAVWPVWRRCVVTGSVSAQTGSVTDSVTAVQMRLAVVSPRLLNSTINTISDCLTTK